MKKYNIGIIGYGGFGRFLHQWWDKLENVQVVAISDGSFDNQESGGLKHYKKWQDLLKDDQVDIVSIATPPAFHVEIACAAMRHNKHVLLEKPIALTNEGAQEILATQQETGMVITIDHMLRYNPIVKALIQLSKEETFGNLRHVVVTNYAQDEQLPANHWFWDKAISGGIFIEHGVHFFDIVNALTTQQVTKVYGCAYNRNERQQDQVAATVLYNEGLIASHYHSFSGPGFFEQTTIRLMYDLAKIEIEGWMPMKGNIEALIMEENKTRIDSIPGLRIEEVKPINNFPDAVQPESVRDSEGKDSVIHSGGISYNANAMISGTFELTGTKPEVYGDCLQAIIMDIIAKIEDPSHKLSITPENAFNALKIAVLAEQSAGDTDCGSTL